MIKQIFSPKIKVKKIEFDFNPNSDKLAADLTAGNTGKYPFVILKGQIIEATNILSFTLKNEKFVPELTIIFNDPTNQFIDDLFPLDNEIISIFIKSNSESFRPVRMDFKVLTFNPVKNTEGVKNILTYKIEGLLNIDYLFYKDSAIYKGTSFEVMKEIANNSNLGFVTNIDNTSDFMKWLIPNQMYLDFLGDIIKMSYKDDNSFMWGFVDFYYNLNYVDIEEQLKEDSSKNFTTIVDTEGEKIVPLILTNNPDYNMTNMYINTYNLISSTTDINLRLGYKYNVRFYDSSSDTLITDLLECISNSGKGGDQIVMKGQPFDYKELFDNVQTDNWYGKQDTDNVHKNYIKAVIQNNNNLEFLQKIKMRISLRYPNFTLYRFQLIRIEIYEYSDIMREKDLSQENVYNKDTDLKKVDSNKINHKLSGDWLITGIKYTFSPVNGAMQEVTLIKRELSAYYEK